MSKAGSTSLQNTLDKGRAALLEQGFLFPESSFTRRDPSDSKRTSGNLELLRMLKVGTETELLDECKQHDGKVHTLILSAENLLFDKSEDELRQLADFLKTCDITIIAVLRHQIDWIISRYAESVTKGWQIEARSIKLFCHDLMERGVLDYGKRIAWFADIFKTNSIHVVNYSDLSSRKALVPRVLELCGIDVLRLNLDVDRKDNLTVTSAETTEAQRRINPFTRMLAINERLKLSATQRKLWAQGQENRLLDRAPLVPSVRTIKMLTAHIAPFNRRLCDDYPSIDPFVSTVEIPPQDVSAQQPDQAKVEQRIAEGLNQLLDARDRTPALRKKALSPGAFPDPLLAPADTVQQIYLRYRQSQVILECPSGPSTMLAASLKNRLVFIVESDDARRLQLQSNIDQLDSAAWVTVHHGPDLHCIWHQDWFRPPDVIRLTGPKTADNLKAVLALNEKLVTVLIEDIIMMADFDWTNPQIKALRRIGIMVELELAAQ
jgi:hypothetical protein